MKRMTRITAIFLCIAMLLSLIGCGAEPPAPTQAPTEAPTEGPTEPPAEDIYAAARDASAASSEFLMKITATQTMYVAGQTFTTEAGESVYYSGFGTDAMAYRSTQSLTYGDDVITFPYDETYIDGAIYAVAEHSDRFRSDITAEAAAARHLNPLMLDASLYGSITAAEGTIHFDAPTAAESWAMPEGAELTEASGTATVGTDGKLQNLFYTITYVYGPAEIKLEVNASVEYCAVTVKTPVEAEQYQVLEDIDSAYLALNATGLLLLSDSVSSSSLQSMMTQAAGVMRNQSGTVHLHRGDTMDAKVETSIYQMNYATNTSDEYEQEEIYTDGTYTFSEDGGDPMEETGVTDEIMEEYCLEFLLANLINADFWENAVISDLGSTLLIELSLSEDFSDAMENYICNTFWYDGKFLRNLSSDYKVNESTGYIAVDKFLGVPTAAGYYYEGAHTIEGQEYLLSIQEDQSIEAPSIGAYHEITEKMPEETEPENKATPLFYHVTGENGQEMWLLGTIHVGDVRTGFLPQEIYDAFAASDALALECDTEAFDEQVEKDDKLSEQVSDLYFFSDGNSVEKLMDDEELYAEAVRLMKATGNYNMNVPYAKPYLWSSSIDQFYLRQGYQLHGDMGVEERLYQWAEDLGKEIREVESNMFQLEMLTGFSDDLQMLMLEESMEINARESWEDTYELYEMWCAGDEAVLREELSDEVDLTELTEEELAEYEAEKHLIDEYNKAMSYDRNDGMLKVAIQYLESGDVVFYAVGLAHLLNNVNGLVDTLRQAGYTVELVQYAQ